MLFNGTKDPRDGRPPRGNNRRPVCLYQKFDSAIKVMKSAREPAENPKKESVLLES
jgi:hypothetical protein